jgi:hypothetical protein
LKKKKLDCVYQNKRKKKKTTGVYTLQWWLHQTTLAANMGLPDRSAATKVADAFMGQAATSGQHAISF